jgi:hypothetical protein
MLNVTIYYLLKKKVFNFHFNFVTLGIKIYNDAKIRIYYREILLLICI